MTKVFLDYDQKALDDAYDQAVYAPNRDQILKRLAYTSELVRKRMIEGGRASEEERKEIDRAVRQTVNDAAEFAQSDPEPDPAELFTDVYA